VTKVAELRDLPDEDLIERLESNKEELFNLRFQLATGQLDNPMRIKQVRHDVARILTVLRERHLELDLEEEVARADREALAHAREGRAEPAARTGLRRFRSRGEAATVGDEAATVGDEAATVDDEAATADDDTIQPGDAGDAAEEEQ